MANQLRASTAIVGAAESGLGQAPDGATPFDLMAQATHRALDDCGLKLSEGVRQVRGECGPRQVPGCEVALLHGSGGVLSSQCTARLGSAAAV